MLAPLSIVLMTSLFVLRVGAWDVWVILMDDCSRGVAYIGPYDAVVGCRAVAC